MADLDVIATTREGAHAAASEAYRVAQELIARGKRVRIAALTTHAMDPERGQFAPMPADIVRQLRGTFTDRSLVAWGKVYEAISRVGAYTSVAFDDAAIHATIADLGGWPAVCRTPDDELPHLQRRFIESHRAYTKRPDTRFAPYLLGVSETENAARGYPVPKPTLIGDPAAARAVIAAGVDSTRVAITAGEAVSMPRLSA